MATSTNLFESIQKCRQEIDALANALHLSTNEQQWTSLLNKIQTKNKDSQWNVLYILKSMILKMESVDSLNNLMQIFIMKMSDLIAKKCVLESEALSSECLPLLKDFWSLSSNQHRSITNQMFGVYSPMLYNVLPSMASLYIDLYVVSCKSKEKTEIFTKRLYGWLNLDLNERCLKTALLEVSLCTAATAAFLLPILRKILTHPPNKSFMDYLLHFVLLRRWSLASKDLTDVVQVNLNVKAPKNFVDWLCQRWHRAREYIPQDKSLKGRRVSDLMCGLDSEAVEDLIDVFTQCLLSQEEQEPEIDKPALEDGTEVADLFVIDKSGSGQDGPPQKKRRRMDESSDPINTSKDSHFNGKDTEAQRNFEGNEMESAPKNINGRRINGGSKKEESGLGFIVDRATGKRKIVEDKREKLVEIEEEDMEVDKERDSSKTKNKGVNEDSSDEEEAVGKSLGSDEESNDGENAELVSDENVDNSEEDDCIAVSVKKHKNNKTVGDVEEDEADENTDSDEENDNVEIGVSEDDNEENEDSGDGDDDDDENAHKGKDHDSSENEENDISDENGAEQIADSDAEGDENEELDEEDNADEIEAEEITDDSSRDESISVADKRFSKQEKDGGDSLKVTETKKKAAVRGTSSPAKADMKLPVCEKDPALSYFVNLSPKTGGSSKEPDIQVIDVDEDSSQEKEKTNEDAKTGPKRVKKLSENNTETKLVQSKKKSGKSPQKDGSHEMVKRKSQRLRTESESSQVKKAAEMSPKKPSKEKELSLASSQEIPSPKRKLRTDTEAQRNFEGNEMESAPKNINGRRINGGSKKEESGLGFIVDRATGKRKIVEDKREKLVEIEEEDMEVDKERDSSKTKNKGVNEDSSDEEEAVGKSLGSDEESNDGENAELVSDENVDNSEEDDCIAVSVKKHKNNKTVGDVEEDEADENTDSDEENDNVEIGVSEDDNEENEDSGDGDDDDDENAHKGKDHDSSENEENDISDENGAEQIADSDAEGDENEELDEEDNADEIEAEEITDDSSRDESISVADKRFSKQEKDGGDSLKVTETKKKAAVRGTSSPAKADMKLPVCEKDPALSYFVNLSPKTGGSSKEPDIQVIDVDEDSSQEKEKTNEDAKTGPKRVKKLSENNTETKLVQSKKKSGKSPQKDGSHEMVKRKSQRLRSESESSQVKKAAEMSPKKPSKEKELSLASSQEIPSPKRKLRTDSTSETFGDIKEKEIKVTEDQVGFMLSQIRSSLNDESSKEKSTPISKRHNTRLRTKSESSDIQPGNKPKTKAGSERRQTLTGIKPRSDTPANKSAESGSARMLAEWLRKSPMGSKDVVEQKSPEKVTEAPVVEPIQSSENSSSENEISFKKTPKTYTGSSKKRVGSPRRILIESTSDKTPSRGTSKDKSAQKVSKNDALCPLEVEDDEETDKPSSTVETKTPKSSSRSTRLQAVESSSDTTGTPKAKKTPVEKSQAQIRKYFLRGTSPIKSPQEPRTEETSKGNTTASPVPKVTRKSPSERRKSLRSSAKQQ